MSVGCPQSVAIFSPLATSHNRIVIFSMPFPTKCQMPDTYHTAKTPRRTASAFPAVGSQKALSKFRHSISGVRHTSHPQSSYHTVNYPSLKTWACCRVKQRELCCMLQAFVSCFVLVSRFIEGGNPPLSTKGSSCPEKYVYRSVVVTV